MYPMTKSEAQLSRLDDLKTLAEYALCKPDYPRGLEHALVLIRYELDKWMQQTRKNARFDKVREWELMLPLRLSHKPAEELYDEWRNLIEEANKEESAAETV